MKQIKILVAGVLWLQVLSAYAQNTRFISTTSESHDRIGAKAPFHYLEEELDTAQTTYIGRVEIAVPEKPSLLLLYNELESQSKKAGANAFRLVAFDQAKIAMTADLYRIDDDVVNRNNLIKPHNTIHVFAGDLYEKTTYDAFEFNGIVQNLRNGTYFKYVLNEGEKAKLKKGTVTGTTMWINWKPNQLPSYYSVRGFGTKTVVKRTSVSQPSRPGKFVTVENALGALLTRVLSHSE